MEENFFSRSYTSDLLFALQKVTVLTFRSDLRATYRQNWVFLFSIKSAGDADGIIVTWFGDLGDNVLKWSVDAHRCAALIDMNTNKNRDGVTLVLMMSRYYILYERSRVVHMPLLRKWLILCWCSNFVIYIIQCWFSTVISSCHLGGLLIFCYSNLASADQFPTSSI